MTSSSGEQAPAETEAGSLRFPWATQAESPKREACRSNCGLMADDYDQLVVLAVK